MRWANVILPIFVFLGLLTVFVRFYVICHLPRKSSQLFPGQFTPVAHRGGASLAPENTMAAFRLAAGLELSFELDVQLSRDGKLVVIHDEILDRTTDAKGRVSEMKADELAALDAGSHFSSLYSGERVPLLSHVLERFGGGRPIIIEVKCREHPCRPGEISGKLVQLLREKGLSGNVLVGSFNPLVLWEIKKLDPSIVRAQIYSDFASSEIPFYQKFAYKNLLFNRFASPDVLMVKHSLVNAGYMKKMHGRGYRVFAWTVDDAAEMRRLKSLGIDGIITNDPVLLLEVMRDEKNRQHL
jgi:glycerophosphoryl diester phosphodiesterase